MSGETNGGVFVPMNLSLFSYTYNNPVNLVDPDGEASAEMMQTARQLAMQPNPLMKAGAAALAITAGGMYIKESILGSTHSASSSTSNENTDPVSGQNNVAPPAPPLMPNNNGDNDDSGDGISSVFTSAKDRTHIFKPKHEMEKLGTSRQDVINKIDKAVKVHSRQFKKGQNQIHLKMNGEKATIRVNVGSNGEVRSVNAFKGLSKRPSKQVIRSKLDL